ncbi:MAG: outer membrane lipid asymmetry maintenance protein MlaD [Alphaproteobacteria bacterium]|nr:outer membrane lipid asymmetry maintenance protein MlaD [Alphaproteobacteria bacterium]MBU6472957.1 outer membrane lipid asymmetry maintenance protein MlaD [Alphaproteobacteria bacterium]MDE2011322.1 outer membrane lipid asymmetry maintenance protein MlaD [Alphaproteobacteria bacterium]MDE2073184.1 outer membrane lipid asymmetry maintenance protein MlaD [Alphaproteobacteria bacterium]MDE2350265.1 outer membrane lipid asymmetry maintenance protein MlaD [Alphaproteobacteria bacterium]
MQNKTVETLIGAIVVFVAAGFLYFAYTATSAGNLTGYEVSAQFSRVDGLSIGTDVRMSGIKIGTVSALDLNPKTYLAVAHLSIRNDIKLPDDSSIKITSSGIMGNPYLSITPGGSDKMIPAGGMIMNTQGSVDLMGLIGRMITSGGK